MITDEEYELAVKAGDEEYAKYGAVGAFFEERTRRVILQLASGVLVAVPVDLLQGLAQASNDDLRSLRLDEVGLGLHIERLDWDMSIPGIMQGRYGSPQWMRSLARR